MNEARPVMLLDTFEELGELTRYFREDFLPRLDGRVKIVIAGRLPLGRMWTEGSPLSPLVQPMPLHDDVRCALAEDLRWRHPGRFHALRSRALEYYRERMRTAPEAERQWLLTERLFLWENGLVQTLLFGQHEPGQVWIEPGRTADHRDIVRLWSYVWTNGMSRSVHVDRQPEGDVLPEAVAAALIRDHFGLFALGGVYLVMVLNSMPRRLLLEACGFERVPEARTWVYGPEDPFDGYVLDLTYIGVERWFEAIVRGQRPPKVRNRSELERELEDALQHWRDDTWLAESNLARAVVPLDLLPPAEEGDRGTGPRFSAVLARPSEGNRQSLTHKRAPCIPRVLLHPSSDATESYGPQQVETGVKPG